MKVDPIILPSKKIDLTTELVPAVRQLLREGLDDSFQKSCVRVGAFNLYSEGLKAELVGQLRVDMHTVLKLGSKELLKHVELMRYVNSIRKNAFPLTLHVGELSGDRIFILTEQCRKHVSLLDKIYRERTTPREFDSILSQVFDILQAIHSVTDRSIKELEYLPATVDPFSKRLRSKIGDILKADVALAPMLDNEGMLNGAPCSSIKTLLDHATKVCSRNCKRGALRLLHGDIHAANILVRRNGPHGYRVRLIDPNPELGFSQVLYDIGKLFHWTDPVGWAKATPSQCKASFSFNKQTNKWKLSASLSKFSQAAEMRRKYVEAKIEEYAEHLRRQYGADFEAMLAISRASAHVGMAAILKHEDQRRYVLAHAVKQLRKAMIQPQYSSPRFRLAIMA